MLILRILFILSALTIILLGATFLLTNNRRYLNLAWQIARFAIFALMIFVLLFILERYVLTAWRVLI